MTEEEKHQHLHEQHMYLKGLARELVERGVLKPEREEEFVTKAVEHIEKDLFAGE